MEFRLLGPIEVFDEVRQCWAELNGPKQRALLATLVVRANTVVPVSLLIEELWGSCPPAKAVNAVQAHVARLRRLLEQHEHDRDAPERLVTRMYGYTLRVDPTETDVGRFKQITAEAKRILPEDPARAARMLRKALAIWRGDALEGEVSGLVCAAQANILDEERLVATETLYDACLQANLHTEIVSELRELTLVYPLRERFHDQLMVALYRCGRQTEALSVYDTARRRLAVEFGLEPTPVLVRRVQEILNHSTPMVAEPAQQRIHLAAAPPASGARPGRPVGTTSPHAAHAPRLCTVETQQESPAEMKAEIVRLRRTIDRLSQEQQKLAQVVDHLAATILPTQRPARVGEAVRLARAAD